MLMYLIVKCEISTIFGSSRESNQLFLWNYIRIEMMLISIERTPFQIFPEQLGFAFPRRKKRSRELKSIISLSGGPDLPKHHCSSGVPISVCLSFGIYSYCHFYSLAQIERKGLWDSPNVLKAP